MNEIKGIVTAIKIAPSPPNNLYTIAGQNSLTTVKSTILLDLNEKVIVKDSIVVDGTAMKKEYSALLEHNSGIFAESKKPKKSNTEMKIEHFRKQTEKMLPKLDEAAKRIVRNLVTGAPIIVRFHNDCDGSSGAIGLWKAFEAIAGSIGHDNRNVSWRMNRSIAYKKEDFYLDSMFFDSYQSVERPLLIASDFGTSDESEAAIELSSRKFDTLWIDHHPIYEKFPRQKIGMYINPWDFGGDSDYTAGMLSCVLAERLVDINLELLKNASLIGDFSAHADRSQSEAQKVAVVLDHLTNKKGDDEGPSPRSMDAIVSDKKKLAQTFDRASEIMNEAVELGVKNVKKHKTRDGVMVYVLDFKHIAGNSDYPLPGRYSSTLQRKFEEMSGNMVMTVVHYGNYVSMRLSKDAAKKIDLLKIIDDMKDASEHVVRGGGHHAAASMMCDKDKRDEVVALLLEQLGASATK